MALAQTMDEACQALGLAEPRRIGGQLTADSLADLFRDHPQGIHLWITDAFHAVTRHVPPEWCFHFWKTELRMRLLEDGVFLREAWPDRYAYLAQQWESPYAEPLVERMRCE